MLKVSVDYIVSVAVIHAADNLLEKPPGVLLLKFPMLDDVVEQLAPGYILHHHEDVRWGADYLVQLDDMWVTK